MEGDRDEARQSAPHERGNKNVLLHILVAIQELPHALLAHKLPQW